MADFTVDFFSAYVLRKNVKGKIKTDKRLCLNKSAQKLIKWFDIKKSRVYNV